MHGNAEIPDNELSLDRIKAEICKQLYPLKARGYYILEDEIELNDDVINILNESTT